ncbi:MAG: hemerythrin domain-containing protein [Planctomycetaceae bacterium]
MGNTEGESAAVRLLSEHHALLEHIRSVRDWVGGVTELGMPRFGELGSRLMSLREELAAHFADEESGRYSEKAPFDTREKLLELRAQHQEILQQLDLLIGRLRATEPDFRSWQAAVERVESVIADICDHVLIVTCDGRRV